MTLFNNPEAWGSIECVPAPSDFNRKRFQKQLDRIAGISATSGKSILKLVWGWEARILVNGEWRQRYVFHTVYLPNGNSVDIATPRWFLEELVEPAQYKEQWDKMRYTFQENSLEMVDSIGPAPVDGLYIPAVPIAEHEYGNECCLRQWAESRRRCVGRYRIPGEDTLEMVRKAVRERDKQKAIDPHSELPQDVMEECQALHYQKKRQWQEDMGYHVKMCINEFVRVFGENFTSDDPTRHKWGKYHQMSGHSPSGLIKENNGSST